MHCGQVHTEKGRVAFAKDVYKRESGSSDSEQDESDDDRYDKNELEENEMPCYFWRHCNQQNSCQDEAGHVIEQGQNLLLLTILKNWINKVVALFSRS